MLHVHKDRTDALTLVDLANDFVGEKENRKQLFGKFSANDIPNTFLYFVKVHTNGKLETKTKGIVDKCSDLACTKKYALRGEGGGVNMGHSLSPPSHFMLATGLWSNSQRREERKLQQL